jgi:hypothetical protein
VARSLYWLGCIAGVIMVVVQVRVVSHPPRLIPSDEPCNIDGTPMAAGGGGLASL